jgi:hypothetical protein
MSFWRGITQIDISYNLLDLDCLKTIVDTMLYNTRIQFFEIAPMLDISCTDDADLLNHYFKELDSLCVRNIENSNKPTLYEDVFDKIDHDLDLDLEIAKTDVKSQRRSSALAHKRFSEQMVNLQKEVDDAREALQEFEFMLQKDCSRVYQQRILEVFFQVC